MYRLMCAGIVAEKNSFLGAIEAAREDSRAIVIFRVGKGEPEHVALVKSGGGVVHIRQTKY